MSTGETAREQSSQKVSSTFLLKLAPSCVRNSIFKPRACQSHCAVLPAHASGFGAQRRGRGSGSSLGLGQDAQRMGQGIAHPHLFVQSGAGVHEYAAHARCSQAACKASCLLSWPQGTIPKQDRQTQTPSQMPVHAEGIRADRWNE